tara:strand:+ start:87 stop:305 length:219 start_codon:yes stop_codon:yes gene_type:complete
MSEQSYLFLSFCAILGVILSYIVPIIGGITEDITVIIANGLIISIVLKNKFRNPKHVQIVETDEIELQAFEE